MTTTKQRPADTFGVPALSHTTKGTKMTNSTTPVAAFKINWNDPANYVWNDANPTVDAANAVIETLAAAETLWSLAVGSHVTDDEYAAISALVARLSAVRSRNAMDSI
jgi:hypothetical protein